MLVCGQDDSVDLVKEFVERLFSLFNEIFILFLKLIRLGFTDYITIDDLVEIFPLLDFVDHNKRKQLLV